MARKRITMMRMMSAMKRHLNLRHTMNFMVLHGLVNQKKDVSGRLMVMESKRRQGVFVGYYSLCVNSKKYTPTTHLFKWKLRYVSHSTVSYLGGSSFGFMLGSSLPFPAGLSSASASLTISSVISTFPCKPKTSKHNEDTTT